MCLIILFKFWMRTVNLFYLFIYIIYILYIYVCDFGKTSPVQFFTMAERSKLYQILPKQHKLIIKMDTLNLRKIIFVRYNIWLQI